MNNYVLVNGQVWKREHDLELGEQYVRLTRAPRNIRNMRSLAQLHESGEVQELAVRELVD